MYATLTIACGVPAVMIFPCLVACLTGANSSICPYLPSKSPWRFEAYRCVEPSGLFPARVPCSSMLGRRHFALAFYLCSHSQLHFLCAFLLPSIWSAFNVHCCEGPLRDLRLPLILVCCRWCTGVRTFGRLVMTCVLPLVFLSGLSVGSRWQHFGIGSC